MRFVLHAAVLDGDDGVLTLLDRLVDRLADEVHRVEVHELDRLDRSAWFQQARRTRKKVLMSATARPRRKASRFGPHAKTIDVADNADAQRADKLAHTPLVILVEDRESDGTFLDLVVEELGWPELKSLWGKGRTVTPRAHQLETAGGKPAIPQRVERAVGDAAQEGRPCRLFVLCDSDARWPGDMMKETDLVIQACVRHQVPHHVLRKRSIENYIPDQVIGSMRADPQLSDHVGRLDALLRRTRLQRDHFPLKDGLAAKERTQAMDAGLYEPSEEEDLKLLETRIFPKQPRPLLRLSRERRPELTAEGLQERDGEGELKSLLRSIAQEL